RSSPIAPLTSLSCSLIFFFYSYADHRDLHSFPTRRSSDLVAAATAKAVLAPSTSAWTMSLKLNRVSLLNALTTIVSTMPYKAARSEEHTSELQSRENLVCRLLLEKKKKI